MKLKTHIRKIVMSEFTTGTGQKLVGVHAAYLCQGRNCVIHSPSEHEYSDWKTNFGTLGCMERFGPNGERVIDPDDLAYWEQVSPMWAECLKLAYADDVDYDNLLYSGRSHCPHCGSDMRGEEIPPGSRHLYGDGIFFSRIIGLYDIQRDMTLAYQCPDCEAVDARIL